MKPINLFFKCFLISIMCFYWMSCTNPNQDKKKIDGGAKESSVPGIVFKRFDEDIRMMAKDSSMNSLKELRKIYGTFLDSIFCKKVMNIYNPNDEYLAKNIQNFITDKDIQNISDTVGARFKNTDDIQNGFAKAFEHYKTLFPGKPIPNVYTMVNAFNYSVITADSTIAIGLELYLGSDCVFYPSLQYPVYKTRKFRREYIVRDAMEGWVKSEYDDSQVKSELLSRMVYNGKMLYALDQVMPEVEDTIKIGFTKAQLDWCKASEGAIWTFFVEKKLLFSKNEVQYARFINDGPTTKGMPKESPANVGSWIGFQIVKKYMKEHPDTSLKQLLAMQDAQIILSGSKYKPELK